MLAAGPTTWAAAPSDLAQVAERGRGLAEAVASRAEQASVNVQTVASATQELAASIREIIEPGAALGPRFEPASTHETQRPSERSMGWPSAAEKIGDDRGS